MPTIDLGPCECCGCAGEVDCSGDCADAIDYNTGPEYVDIFPPFSIWDEQTITVPASYSLPVTVCYSGECDDGLAINGRRVSLFAETPPPFCINERTFTAGTYNARGAWQCTGSFCFTEGCCASLKLGGNWGNPLP